MGDQNQREWVLGYRNRLMGSILEVGSKRYPNTNSFREEFIDHEYLGVDMEEGSGVDRVIDLSLPFDHVDRMLGGKRFGAILFLSVMEHCRDPFTVAANLSRLMAPGGWILLSAPFSWEFHGYPDDYWRFTESGLRALFPDLVFEPAEYSTAKEGERGRLAIPYPRVPLSWREGRREGRYGAGGVFWIRLAKALGLFSWLFGYPYLLPPTLINLAGRKPDPTK